MKKLLLVLILCSIGLGLKAHDFAVMNSDGKLIYYNICSTSSPYSAMVTFKGNGPWDYSGEYSGTINIPSTVIFNSITYSVDSIKESCFDNCPLLLSVNIPNSVKSIGRGAFNACHNLSSVNLPNTITIIKDNTFAWCKSLTSINIPNTVTSIEMSAFYGDSSLASIVLPNSLTYIGYGVFHDCVSLSSIIIPNSVTTMESSVFENCSNLSSISFSTSLDSIPDYTFRQCTSLSSITIPNTITYLGGWAFCNCTSLRRVSLPNTINSINFSTFYWCTQLDSVVIPNSVTTIGDYAFHNCNNLHSIQLTNSITSIGTSAFQSCSQLQNITLPNKLTVINNYTFAGCTGLTSVQIPNSVITIGNDAFSNIMYLSNLTIPNSVTSIGVSAFYNCNFLSSITIPSSVVSIGASAFGNCFSLSSITNLSLIPQTINNTTFYQVNTYIPLYVPCGYASIYQGASNWNAFNIQANQPITKNINAWICPNQTYTQNGFNADSTGIYTRNLTAVGGCDSIIYLILKVKVPDTTRIDASICQGQVYNYNGFNANTTGEYYQTIPSSIGCDSTLVLNLLVFQPDTTIIIATLCPGQPYSQNGFYTGTPGVHVLHLYNQNGCDSTLILNLSYYSNDTTFIYANICQGESYNFFNMNYNIPGTYARTTSSSHWCDSTVVLNLTISPRYNLQYNGTICQGEVYNQNGFICDSSGTYTNNGQSIYGCDSTTTLYLTVNPSTNSTIFDTICQGETYIFYNISPDTTGIYTYNYQNQYGCNSIATLNLKVINKSYSSIDTTTCNTYYLNGIGYSNSGTFEQRLINSEGCDSIITLNLNIPVANKPEICMVTVNENKKNVIIWNKEDAIEEYYILKEGNRSGNFETIATLPSDAQSIWVDSNSNASTRSYSYQIAAKDTCEHYLNNNKTHKTLHLTINQGLNNSWNLIWTPYEGIQYGTYNIYKGRYNRIDSLYLLTTIPSSNTSYTDIDNNESDIYYQIEILLDNPCNFTKSTSSIRSNIVSNSEIGLSDIEYQSIITLYPNPTKDKTVLSVEGIKNDAQVMVYDIFGRMIKSYSLKANQKGIEINVSNLASGTYYVICKDTVNGLSITKKLIVY